MSSGDTDVTTVRLEQQQIALPAPAHFCGTYRHRIDEKGRVGDSRPAAPLPPRRQRRRPRSRASPDDLAAGRVGDPERPLPPHRRDPRSGAPLPAPSHRQQLPLRARCPGATPPVGASPGVRPDRRHGGLRRARYGGRDHRRRALEGSRRSSTQTSSPRSGTSSTSAARPHLRRRRERPRRIRLET